MAKIILIEKKAIELQCKRCSYKWLYTGTNKYVVSCPHCGTKIGIRKLLQQTELVGLGISTKSSKRCKHTTHSYYYTYIYDRTSKELKKYIGKQLPLP
ncbi:MAG: hypothetical protein ACJ71K_20380 [Nitrososphaeraceae archaeon]